MLSLNDRDAVTVALTDTTLNPQLRAIIGLRLWQADTDRRRPLSDILQIAVVEPGDPPEVVHEAIGWPICYDQAEQPGWEWMNHHPGYGWELCYILTDDFGMLVFVPDHPDTNDTLLFNCRGVANRPGPLENKP
jgi:hypothetical protein